MKHIDKANWLLKRIEDFVAGNPLLSDIKEFISEDVIQQELRILALRNTLSKVVECESIHAADEMINYLRKFPENLNDKAVIEALEVLKAEFLLQKTTSMEEA